MLETMWSVPCARSSPWRSARAGRAEARALSVLREKMAALIVELRLATAKVTEALRSVRLQRRLAAAPPLSLGAGAAPRPLALCTFRLPRHK